MYIAASTMASEAIVPSHHASWNAPSRIRNSDANVAEPGTASAQTPTMMQIVAEHGPAAGEAAEQPEVAGADRALHPAREQEEGRGEQGVVDHREGRAGRALVVEHEDAQHDQAHLADRRVRDHAARVGLPEGQVRAVQEAGRGERDQRPAPVGRGAGEDRQHDRDQGVRAGLRRQA